MKNLLLAAVIGLYVNAYAQTPTYSPMLSDSNTWAVYIDLIPIIQQPHGNNTQSQNPQVQNFGPDYVKWIKDTIVDSLTYKMFYSRTHDGNPAQWSLLREDTATQQVFIYSAGDTAERIIYDFSLNTGDSIWLDFRYGANMNELQDGWYYVDSTNLYTINTGAKKALYLSNPNNPLYNGNQVRSLQWLESVGCNISPVYLDENNSTMMSGLDFLMGPGCGFNTHYYSVTCAWQDSLMTFSSECWENVRNNMTFWYPNGDTCIFMLMGPVEDPGLGLSELQLLPNPAHENCQLLFNGESATEFSITITNIMGQTVEEVSPLSWYARGMHSVQLNLSEYPSGIYSVNLIGATGRVSIKLIVQ